MRPRRDQRRPQIAIMPWRMSPFRHRPSRRSLAGHSALVISLVGTEKTVLNFRFFLRNVQRWCSFAFE